MGEDSAVMFDHYYNAIVEDVSAGYIDVRRLLWPENVRPNCHCHIVRCHMVLRLIENDLLKELDDKMKRPLPL